MPGVAMVYASRWRKKNKLLEWRARGDGAGLRAGECLRICKWEYLSFLGSLIMLRPLTKNKSE